MSMQAEKSSFDGAPSLEEGAATAANASPSDRFYHWLRQFHHRSVKEAISEVAKWLRSKIDEADAKEQSEIDWEFALVGLKKGVSFGALAKRWHEVFTVFGIGALAPLLSLIDHPDMDPNYAGSDRLQGAGETLEDTEISWGR
ncbi:hypothetical protein C8R43DRAFT_1103464 [Mycena crocata]|nr:hypothetical protein C8R43DRAFT_1103464 [Mycena crocata]